MASNIGPIHQLILEAAIGARLLAANELQQVLEHVAQAGFHPARNVPASGLAGLLWQGRVLTGSDLLTSAERHYLRHVIHLQEWPSSTSLTAYLASIRAVILDPSSGVFTSRFRQEWQLGIIRESQDLRGPRQLDWVLREYRVSLGHLVTAFQLPSLQAVHIQERTDVQWLRLPT